MAIAKLRFWSGYLRVVYGHILRIRAHTQNSCSFEKKFASPLLCALGTLPSSNGCKNEYMICFCQAGPPGVLAAKNVKLVNRQEVVTS